MFYHAEIEMESNMDQEEFKEWLIDALRNISANPNNTNVNDVYEEYIPWI